MTNNTSLMTFPCDFPVKIMGKNTPSFVTDITAIAHKYFIDCDVISVRHQASRLNNYIAVTLTVHAEDQKTLDAMYLDLTKLPDVKMVL